MGLFHNSTILKGNVGLVLLMLFQIQFSPLQDSTKLMSSSFSSWVYCSSEISLILCHKLSANSWPPLNLPIQNICTKPEPGLTGTSAILAICENLLLLLDSAPAHVKIHDWLPLVTMAGREGNKPGGIHQSMF